MQLHSGVPLSPLWHAPGFLVQMITIDVLHCLDLGVTQDCLGNLFWECITHPTFLSGGSKQKRVDTLRGMILAHYREFKTSVRLQGLTVEMIKQDQKMPKLRAKGAETRHVVPFGCLLAQKLHEADPTNHNLTVKNLMDQLCNFYCLMGHDDFDAKAAADCCRKCCLYYGALSQEIGATGWRCKPKMHMWQEMAEFQTVSLGNPRDFWTYKDEDFVGFVAQLAHSRGGGGNSRTVPNHVFARYRGLAQQEMV